MAPPIGKIKNNLTMSPLGVSCTHCLPRISRSQVVHIVLNRKLIAQNGKFSLQYKNMLKRRLKNVQIF